MMLDEKNVTRQYMDQFFLKHEILTGQVQTVSNMDLLIDFSKIGMGIGCVIRDFVEQEIADGTLTELVPPYSLPKRTVGFAYNKIAAQNDSIKCFIDFYKGEKHLC